MFIVVVKRFRKLHVQNEEYSLAEKLEGISLSDGVIKSKRKLDIYLLVKNFCVASKVKLEHAPQTPYIYGISPVEELEDVRIRVDKAHVDRFILICPKTWDGMLRADCTQNYNCMESLKPET